jgi:2-polyprenyl-3-methyl-5-hydroxy-6-metoxy-1,4-benzoquinol methylase
LLFRQRSLPKPGGRRDSGAMETELLLDEAFWDERYSSSERVWSGNPNPQLVSEITGMKPGSALDVGCGEGADAIWLAEQGWQVTGSDISGVALEKAAAHARERGIEVTWLHADIAKAAPPGTFDLVSAHFIHMPTRAERIDIQLRLAAAVAPGGTLLIVGHDPSDMLTQAPRPQIEALYYTAAEVAALLPDNEWIIEVEEARPRPFEGYTIRDAILKARRR